MEPFTQDAQIPDKLKVMAMLLQHNPQLCETLKDESVHQLTDHVSKNPQQHSNLFKGLMASFFRLKLEKFYPPFRSLVTQNITCANITPCSLPTDLQEFLLQHQDNSGTDYSVYEVDKKNSLSALSRHPAIIVNEDEIRIDKNHVRETVKQLPLLHHILKYEYPENCLALIKLALKEGAPIIYTSSQRIESTESHAKSYNASCVLFLQEYINLMPRYDENIGTQSYNDHYERLFFAYNSFMLDDNPWPLYNLLKPNITDKGLLDQTTLLYRTCFSSTYNNSLAMQSYLEEYNSKFLYTQLLPMLQAVKIASDPANTAHDEDTIFFSAILDNKPEIISTMCQRGYNPNSFYANSTIPNHYGSLPLWSAIAEGNPDIVQILLKNGALLNLNPLWSNQTVAQFTLYSCFYQNIQRQHVPISDSVYHRHLATLRTILKQVQQNINSTEHNGKTLLEHAIRLATQNKPQKPKKSNPETINEFRVTAKSILKDENIEIIELLLELGANPFQNSSENISFEELAEKLNHPTLAQWLKDYKQSHPL